MKKNNIKQLIIVCRNYNINWKQFINPIFIGVETGIWPLIKNNKKISFFCGDNDTIKKKELKILNNWKNEKKIETIIFKKDKDFIDSELAIIIAISKKINFQQIVIISDGMRWDMLMANINIIKKYELFNPILLGKNNYCFLLKEKTEYFFHNWQLKYKYISFFSLNNKKVIYNFSGCKFYPNKDIIINNKNTKSISNEFNKKEKPKIIIKKGKCLIFLYK